MGAEYLALDTENQLVHAGHHATFTFVGDLDSVRDRLVSAVEKLGYLVIEETPIIARHTKSKYSSSSILDYVHTLTIRLKSVGENSTRAIFEYQYLDMYGKGARAVLTQQAKAIAAFAAARNRLTVCNVCSTSAADESRFCRNCGAPMHGVPAELELMTATAESHAGYLCMIQGTIGFFLAFLTLLLVMAIKGPAYITSALVFTMIWAIPSFIIMLFGMRRLRRVFKLEADDNPTLDVRNRDFLNAPPAYAQSPAAVSVVEGTTELLSQPADATQTSDDRTTGKL